MIHHVSKSMTHSSRPEVLQFAMDRHSLGAQDVADRSRDDRDNNPYPSHHPHFPGFPLVRGGVSATRITAKEIKPTPAQRLIESCSWSSTLLRIAVRMKTIAVIGST